MKSKHVVFGFFVASELLMLVFAFASVALYRPCVALYAACVAAVLLCIVADVALFSAVAKAAERAEQVARTAALAKEQQAAAYYGQRLVEERAAARGVKAQVVSGLIQARDALASEVAGTSVSEDRASLTHTSQRTANAISGAPLATSSTRFCDHSLVDAVLSIEGQTC